MSYETINERETTLLQSQRARHSSDEWRKWSIRVIFSSIIVAVTFYFDMFQAAIIFCLTRVPLYQRTEK